MVYLIVNEEKTVCKIGYAKDVNSRLKGINTNSFYKMYIEEIIDGGIERENDIHQMFSDFRLNGEWFTYNKVMSDYFKEQKNVIYKTFFPNNRRSYKTDVLNDRKLKYNVDFKAEMLSLTETALKLYLSLPLFYDKKDNRVILIKHVKESIAILMDSSVPTVEKGIKELVDKKILFRIATSTYQL